MVNETRPKRKRGKKTIAKPTRAKRSPSVDRQIRIQKALYEIAAAASAVTDMQEFCATLHRIVGKLMYARSFYITLYDAATGTLTSPYFADEAGDTPPPPTRIDSSNKSLRAYVLLKGKTLHVSAEEIEEGRRRGRFAPMGTPAEDWIGVPLKIDGQVIGSLTVQSYEKGVRYEEHDVQLLEFVAEHIAIALTRARAIDETRQRNSELQIINSVQAGLASKLDMQSIYELVGDKIRDIFDAQGVTIATYDPATNLLHYRYSIQEGERIDYDPAPLSNKGFRAHIIRTRQFLRLDDVEAEGTAYGLIKLQPASAPVTSKSDAPKSWLGVPLMVGNEARGVVNLYNVDRTHAYNDMDIRLLQTLVNSMSVALENARLFDETLQRNAELAIINSVQEGLASKLDEQAIYQLVGEKISSTFAAQVVSIDTYDRDAHLLHGCYYSEAGRVLAGGTYPCFGFRKHVIEHGQPIIIRKDMSRWMEEYDNPVILGLQPKSAVFIPMTVGGEAMGVISLQNNNQENAFAEADVRLLTTLANSMSVALENARLWEQEKLFRKALERELEIGREIQAGFLPETLPQVEGWEIAASLMSAREVAGDFYDAFELPDGNIGLVIADVCDKGVGAALFMTLFRSLIRAAANLEYFEHAENTNTPHSSAERLNRAILLTNNYIAETHGESGMFATLFFGILDPHDGKLIYVNGGHEPPLLMRVGKVHEALHKTGPAVGAIANCRFGMLETQLQEGDILFAFTDGVLDCQNPRGDFYGREQLLNVLRCASDSSYELVRTVESDLHHYIAGATQFDDITLLAVRRGWRDLAGR